MSITEENRADEMAKVAMAEREAMDKRMARYRSRGSIASTVLLFVIGAIIGVAILAAFEVLGI